MRQILLTLAATAAIMIGGLAMPNTAEAQRRVVRTWGYPTYYSYPYYGTWGNPYYSPYYSYGWGRGWNPYWGGGGWGPAGWGGGWGGRGWGGGWGWGPGVRIGGRSGVWLGF